MNNLPEPMIIVMAKRPRPGHNKTRLTPPLSPEGAAALYEAMLMDTLALVENLGGVRVAVGVTPGSDTEYFEPRVDPETVLYPVDGADLGDCLDGVLTRALTDGYSPVMAINSDGPSLPPAYIGRAIGALAQASDPPDVVLGPNPDGGYYLVGMNRPQPALFRNVEWSTPQVWEQTLENAGQAGLRVEVLPSWHDVDTAADLDQLRADVASSLPDQLVHTRRFFEK